MTIHHATVGRIVKYFRLYRVPIDFIHETDAQTMKPRIIEFLKNQGIIITERNGPLDHKDDDYIKNI